LSISANQLNLHDPASLALDKLQARDGIVIDKKIKFAWLQFLDSRCFISGACMFIACRMCSVSALNTPPA
jgi:hypothetical protein